jgi:hypothetical protein
MSTIFILAGSMLGFVLGMASLVIGAGLTFAMLLWTGLGLISALLSVALSTTPPSDDQNAVAQSA